MKKLLMLLGILIGGGAVGWVIGSFGKAMLAASAVSPPGAFWFVLQLVAAGFLAILVHELGHVVGGRLAGYSFVMLVVGPFKWVRERGRVRWRWNTSLNVFGGLALMVPLSGQSDSRGMARYILGGPVASFCLFLIGIAGIVAFTTMGRHVASFGHLGFFLVVVAAMALMTGLATLIPCGAGGWMSDGGQYLDLARGGHRAERRLLMLTVTARSLNGVRPRDWDASLVTRMLELAAGRTDQLAAVAHQCAYFHFLDLGRIDDAAAQLDQALGASETLPAELRPGLRLERAYFTARYRRDPEAAAEFLKSGSGGFVEPHTRARAEAAVALGKGDVSGAIAAIDLALSRMDRTMDPGGSIAEKEWLLDLRRQAERPDRNTTTAPTASGAPTSNVNTASGPAPR